MEKNCLSGEDCIYLLPNKNKVDFYVASKDEKTIRGGQYLKISMQEKKLSCHVRGSHTIQIIDALGRESFKLSKNYLEKILSSPKFRIVEFKSVS